jgi:hypothetical protein
MGLISDRNLRSKQQKAGTTTVDVNAPLSYTPPEKEHPLEGGNKKQWWESGWDEISDFGEQAWENVKEVGEAGEGLIRGGLDIAEEGVQTGLEGAGDILEPVAEEAGRFRDRYIAEANRELEDVRSGFGLFGEGEEPEYAPQSDPRLDALQKRLAEDAKKYEAGTGRRLEEGYGLLAGAAGQAFQKGQRQLKEDYARRGGLYGGDLQADIAGRRGEASSAVAQGLIQSRIEEKKMIDQMKLSAFSVGLEGWANILQQQSDLFNINLANEAQRRSAISNIGRGLGAGFGAYAAYKADNPPGGDVAGFNINPENIGADYANPQVDYNLGGDFNFTDSSSYSNPYGLR